MRESQRGLLIGLYTAGLVMLTEGILEVWPDTIWQSSSGERHLALGGLLFLFAIVYLRSRKKDDEPKKSK
jgi:hypothetical protein